MDTLGELVKVWLNPVNLGAFFVLSAAAIWVISRSNDQTKGK
ncbi:MAG: hypothetical protein U0559_20110 [Anaerolineae bacterium]